MFSVNGVYQDINLTCSDCGMGFVFTIGEQQFYEQKKLHDKPKRCKGCRDIRKAQKNQQSNSAPSANDWGNERNSHTARKGRRSYGD